MTEVFPADQFKALAMEYVKTIAELPIKSMEVSKALVQVCLSDLFILLFIFICNSLKGPEERAILKSIVRKEGEFLKERWFSDDAKQAMMKFVNSRKK